MHPNGEGAAIPECLFPAHDRANAAIAASRVGSQFCAARRKSPLWPLAAHI
jgi:hypothetical protein